MSIRIPTTPIVRGLFSNVPIEAGNLSDAEIVRKFGPTVPHKTFSRIRIRPPRTISSEQLLLLARLLPATTGVEASELFYHVRHPRLPVCSRLKMLATAEVFDQSPKTNSAVTEKCDALARTARTIRLFDRGSSFSYLRPSEDNEVSTHAFSHQSPDQVRNMPEILITLTLSSLIMRQQVFGDEAVECLIDHVERDAHLTVINDSPRNLARTRRGIFEDAKAAAIIDNRTMFVFPDHGRAIRCYSTDHDSAHSGIIRLAIDQLNRISQFRMPLPDRSAMIAFLKSLLSYRLPSTSEKFDTDGSSGGSRTI